MPLRKYYSEYHLRNSGEKVVAQMLAHSLNYFREQWFMVHSWLRSGHLKDTAGECDFIIIGQKGLLVLEVKGSQWKLEQNRFFQTRHKEWEERENPFQQARNNKAAVIEILGKRGINHVLVTSAAIFPECSFPLDEPPDPFWHMGRRERQDLASFVVTVLDEQYEQQKEVNLLPLRVLSNNEMQEIADMLCPSVLPNEVYAHLSLSREEAKKRAVDNIRILDGLRDNERLIVQGPPGSGKSTYAMSLANRRNRQGDGKILYLCWNELLAVYNDFKFKETGNQNVLVSAYFPFIRYLKSVAGFNPDDLNFEEVDRPGGIAAHLREALDKLEEIGQLPEYDYIIVDECQDLFHRGVELIIDRLSRGRNGLIAGRFAIFFDNSQVFSVNLDRERYESAFAKLKSAAASYKIDYRLSFCYSICFWYFISR
jgi:adenylate kinase family enzyme